MMVLMNVFSASLNRSSSEITSDSTRDTFDVKLCSYDSHRHMVDDRSYVRVQVRGKRRKLTQIELVLNLMDSSYDFLAVPGIGIVNCAIVFVGFVFRSDVLSSHFGMNEWSLAMRSLLELRGLFCVLFE